MRKNNRRHLRYPGTLTVQVSGDGVRRFGTIFDVSAGGAFLAVSPLPAIGSVVRIGVVPGSARRLTLTADVRYYCTGLRGPRGLEGVGVAWRDLGAEELAFVHDLLARASAGRPLREGESPVERHPR